MRTLTVTVVVRHSVDCSDKEKGTDWRKCNCRKSLLVYDGATRTQKRISAQTRSWDKAETFKHQYIEDRDPLQQELKRLQTAEQQKPVSVEKAIELYLTDMIFRLGDNGTVQAARNLLERGLCEWLIKQPQHPVHISEITSDHLNAWRTSWKLADLTAATRWVSVKTFFNFCEKQGWIPDSPARRLRAPKVVRGGRTAIFTDAQYTAILNAVRGQQRLTTFIELLRWGGMALVDAVQFRTDMVDSEGVLRYRRHKTDTLAVVPLPAHVVVMLRDVPLAPDSVGPEQPFRTKHLDIIKCDVARWQRELRKVFARAGIISVQTESGRVRKPHPHMFRDTCAVSALRHGAAIHAVARMLGHTKIETTQTAYMPYCKELEDAQIANVRAAQTAAQPKPIKGRKVLKMGSR